MKTDLEILDEALTEALDVITDLLEQHAGGDAAEIHDYALSTNEDACEFLARMRPDVWTLTPRGIRRR